MRNGHYAPIHLHRHGDRYIDRHKDREIGDMEIRDRQKMMMPHHCLELIDRLVVGCRVVVLLWFSLAQIFCSP